MATVDSSEKTHKFLFLFHYFSKSPSTGEPSHRCSCSRSMPQREALLGKPCPTTAEMGALHTCTAAAPPPRLQQQGPPLSNPPGLKHDFSEQCGLSMVLLSFPQHLTLLWREPVLTLDGLLYSVKFVSLRTRLSHVWHEVE